MVNFGSGPFNFPNQQQRQFPQPGNSGGVPLLPSLGAGIVEQQFLVRTLDSLLAGGKLAGAQQSPGAPGLSQLETAVFIKNLLNLPKEIQALLLLLAQAQETPSPQAAQKLKKLLEDEMETLIPLETIQEVLTNKSQDAMQKLLKLLVGKRAGTAADGQSVEDVFKKVSSLQTHVQRSPVDALNAMMLLYLPPLILPQAIQITFRQDPPSADSESESGGGEPGYNMVLFIETITLGKFKISLGLVDRTQVIIRVEHDAVAEPVLPTVEKQLAASLADDGMPPPVWTPTRREPSPALASQAEPEDAPEQLTDTPGTEKTPEKKIAVHPGQGVSILVVHTAFLLAKLLFQMDERRQ